MDVARGLSAGAKRREKQRGRGELELTGAPSFLETLRLELSEQRRRATRAIKSITSVIAD